MGSIEIIIGSMFSGKSTELLRRLTRYQLGGKKVILLRPNTDTRGKITHDDIKSKIEERYINKISDLTDYASYDVIGVDEGQFIHDLAQDSNLLANQDKLVIIAGLNATSEAEPFPEIQACIPIAEHITRLNAVCTRCGSQDGSFTYYKRGNKKTAVLVGENEYTAVCRKCYNELTKTS